MGIILCVRLRYPDRHAGQRLDHLRLHDLLEPRRSRLNRLTFLIALAAGVVVGVASSIGVARWQLEKFKAREDAALQQRLSDLQRPVVTIPIISPPAAAPAVPVPAQPSTREGATAGDVDKPSVRRPTGEERLAQLRAYDEDKIQKHWAEPVDSSWSASTTPSLRTGLETLAKDSKFTVKEVDCRSTSCIAVFDWPRYSDAFSEYGKIAHARLDVNCSRGITLPDVQDKSQPVQATMYFDCGQWKARGSVSAVSRAR